jgi:hypothetical protein
MPVTVAFFDFALKEHSLGFAVDANDKGVLSDTTIEDEMFWDRPSAMKSMSLSATFPRKRMTRCSRR